MDNLVSNITLSPRPYLREYTLTYKILVPTWPAIVLFGLFANIINIVVFLKSGVKDNVTTSLLSLSVSDVTFLVLSTPSVCSFLKVFYAPDWHWPFYEFFLHDLLFWPAYTFYDFSSYISVWLGVTRCACVAMPLKFKSVFTKARTVKTILVLFILAVGLRIPVMSVYTLMWIPDPRTNVSSVFLMPVNSESRMRFNDIMNRISLPWITFIIMITCVCVIKVKLYQASLVRTAHTQTSSSESKQPPDGQEAQGRSSKDLRVIQSVVLICSIFIASQFPFLVYSTVRLINPEFDVFGRLQNIFFILGGISQTCAYLNASVNIFVYCKYNSKYRSIILSMILSTSLQNLMKK
ncbi:chemosensory receptor a [Plakobranchus ocellatus]|uniref:Chemosensory receptor a n=1 Tax=Plakobranchus ocellatus TaxID=259542 RepID=A0AAV3YNJ9_9GAST|nr:chemosensory receptor a [Plakobranchus ocellatus]